MKHCILALLILTGYAASAQNVINYDIPSEGQIFLTPEIAIPKVNRGYTIWLPKAGEVRGLIVFTHARRDTMNGDSLIGAALKNQLAVLYTTTDNRLEFFFDTDRMIEIEKYIQSVIVQYQIPAKNLFYCGMSLEGTRALKLAAFGQSEQSKYRLVPKAIAICDSPLDMIRFHKEMIKAKTLKYTPITANEGTWVSGYLESNLGGTPDLARTAYIIYSPYCYAADGGVNLQFFKEIAIRAYTEPDVNWWIKTRRKDYYSMNAVDLAGFINELKIIGNDRAELILTHDKGFNPDGTRHPHSWSIVDEVALVNWFVTLIE